MFQNNFSFNIFKMNFLITFSKVITEINVLTNLFPLNCAGINSGIDERDITVNIESKRNLTRAIQC